MMLAALRSPSTWWLVVWGPVAILLLGLGSGILPFGVYLVGLLIAGLAAIPVGIVQLTNHCSERRWLAAVFGALLPFPLLFFSSFIDAEIRAGDSADFRLKREAFQARVAELPTRSEPRFLGLKSEPLGSAGAASRQVRTR